MARPNPARRWRARLRGWRTVLVMAPVVLLGLLDQVQAIDLRPVLTALGVPEERVGGIVAGLGLLALLLRTITTGPLGAARGESEEPR